MRWISGILTVLCLVIAGNAEGQQGCQISAPSFRFGNYDPSSPFPLDSVGEIGIACPPGTAYMVSLDAGSNSGEVFHPRRMRGPDGRTLDYNFYVDAPGTQVWGDGAGGTSVRPGVASGNWGYVIVYGRMPAHQNVSAGSYDDQVVVTVEW